MTGWPNKTGHKITVGRQNGVGRQNECEKSIRVYANNNKNNINKWIEIPQIARKNQPPNAYGQHQTGCQKWKKLESLILTVRI